MGTTNSKNTKEHQILHERFQNAKILNNDQIQIHLRTTLDDYNTWKLNLKKISFANKENVLFPLNHSFHQQGWCSQNTGLLKISFDNYPFVFEEQLENRITLERHLSQEEMWYLLYTLVSTAKDFSQINRKVGDIRPHNIFVNDAGQVKLGICFSWPNQPSNLQKTISDKIITYLSPQEMEICKNGKMQTLVNSTISQSFSIGLTMLHAGLLYDFRSLYNIEKYQINRKLLEEKIQHWMQLDFYDENGNKVSYSIQLKKIIKNLCSYQALGREKSLNIFTLLHPHKEAIHNIESFTIKYQKNPESQQKRQYIHDTHNIQAQSILSSEEKNNPIPIFTYAERARRAPSTQTPISFNPHYDFSTRHFTQVPSYYQNSQTNHYFEVSDQFSNSPQKQTNHNIRLSHTMNTINTMNTMNQRQSIDSKPIYITQSSIRPGTINVKPFVSIDEQVQQTTVFQPINVGGLEKHVEKKVESTHLIQLNSFNIKEKQVQLSNVCAQSVTTSNDSSDFLKKIEEQIQKSKSMFPS